MTSLLLIESHIFSVKIIASDLDLYLIEDFHLSPRDNVLEYSYLWFKVLFISEFQLLIYFFFFYFKKIVNLLSHFASHGFYGIFLATGNRSSYV